MAQSLKRAPGSFAATGFARECQGGLPAMVAVGDDRLGVFHEALELDVRAVVADAKPVVPDAVGVDGGELRGAPRRERGRQRGARQQEDQLEVRLRRREQRRPVRLGLGQRQLVRPNLAGLVRGEPDQTDQGVADEGLPGIGEGLTIDPEARSALLLERAIGEKGREGRRGGGIGILGVPAGMRDSDDVLRRLAVEALLQTGRDLVVRRSEDLREAPLADDAGREANRAKGSQLHGGAFYAGMRVLARRRPCRARGPNGARDPLKPWLRRGRHLPPALLGDS